MNELQDKVALVVYAGAAGVVLPSTAGDKKETIKITSATKLKIQLSNGGGWVASIRKVK